MAFRLRPSTTALGVAGVAVALALQDTLANLFAGVHIMMEKSVRIGDFVKLETGQEGHVVDITWRTTRVRMPSNNMVVIPNSKLAQSVVTNYYLPEKPMSLSISISVSYSADPEAVERILVEEAKKGAVDIRVFWRNRNPSYGLFPVSARVPWISRSSARWRNSPISTSPSTSSARGYSDASRRRASRFPFRSGRCISGRTKSGRNEALEREYLRIIHLASQEIGA